MTGVPAVAGLGETVLVNSRSARGTTVELIVSVLLATAGSTVDERTVAEFGSVEAL